MSPSLCSQLDDIFKCYQILTEGCEQELRTFVLNQEKVRLRWLEAVNECHRLKGELDSANNEITKLSLKLRTARAMVDRERNLRKDIEKHFTVLMKDVDSIENKVMSASIRNRTNKDTRIMDYLNKTDDIDSDSRSELTYSRSDDDLDISCPTNGKSWRKSIPSTYPTDQLSAKRRRSSISSRVKKSLELNSEHEKIECVIATTTVTVNESGEPITASSVIETMPPVIDTEYPIISSTIDSPVSAPPPLQSDSDFELVDMKSLNRQDLKDLNQNIRAGSIGRKKINSRVHQFITKTVIKPEICGPCKKRITFGKIALKCLDCRAVSHFDCKNKVPLPCVPIGNTPTNKGSQKGTIADYAPPIPPMIPAIVIHCVNEIERRGLSHLGIYRVPGSDKDVKSLKEKFMRQKSRGAPDLSVISDINVVCGCLKDFLRNLSEPLITDAAWSELIRVTEIKTESDNQNLNESQRLLFQVIANLPQPNRDTLAYVILHLQRVAEAPTCKMPASNLATVFGPTIIGPKTFSSEPSIAWKETQQASNVVKSLLRIPSENWASFISGTDNHPSSLPSQSIRNTPSTEILTSRKAHKFFSESPSKRKKHRSKQFFSPPNQVRKN